MVNSTKVTLSHIAREVGVSVSTVSRALAPDSSVQKETRERILRAARRLGYTPPGAGAVAVNELVALCLPSRYTDHRPHFYTSGVVRGCYTVLRQGRFVLTLVGGEELNDGRLLRLFPALKGLLIVRDEPAGASGNLQGTTHSVDNSLSDKEREFLGLSLPTVFLGSVSYAELSAYPYAAMVDVDNYGSGQLAVKYLSQRGHWRIAHIAGPRGRLPAESRRKGYLDAIKQLEIKVPDSYMVETQNWHQTEGYGAMQQLLSLSPFPTAVFCASDALASGAKKAIINANLKVPEDISLVGHDNSEHAEADDLTTIDHQLSKLASEGLALLDRLIKGERHLPQIILRPMLVERDSCANAQQ